MSQRHARELRDLLDEANELGWALLRRTGHNNYLLAHPLTGQRVSVSSTPRDPNRAYANARAMLRRFARQETRP